MGLNRVQCAPPHLGVEHVVHDDGPESRVSLTPGLPVLFSQIGYTEVTDRRLAVIKCTVF
jgi:hypothetical protein